jgi:hypothetical protein
LGDNEVGDDFLEVDCATVHVLFLPALVQTIDTPLVYHVALRVEPKVYNIIE